MAEYVLETKDLGISFGGLKAVENVDLKIKKKQLYGLVGPNGAGKTTVFNMLTGVYQPTTGTFYLNGEELRGKSQEQINHKGIARTFQNIRLFNNMSVLKNCMTGQMKVLHRPVVNDIVLSADGVLVPFLSYDEYTEQDYAGPAASIAENYGKLNDHVEANGGSFYFVGLPEQRVYFEEKFPD